MLTTTLQNDSQTAQLEGLLDSLGMALAQSYEEQALFHRVMEQMRLTQKPETFFQSLCRETLDTLDCQMITMLWPDRDTHVEPVKLVAHIGAISFSQEQLDQLWRRTINQLGKSQGYLIDSDVDGPCQHRWPAAITNLVGVPIRRGSTDVGALVAMNKQSRADFDFNDIRVLLSLADIAAIYLQNFRLYQDLEDLMIGSLKALISSIDAKDPYTCGHSERVALIARFIAERMFLPSQHVHIVYLTGLLHDVGKIGVPEAVLSKPGRLTPEEIEEIRKHPRIGATILTDIRQLIEVTPGVLTHHERFDGKGYPQGIGGRGIPLSGRIVMLADSFDAMISRRTYRRALPIMAALSEVRRFSGTQFDPDIADILLTAEIDELARQLDEYERMETGKQPRIYRPIAVVA